MRNEIPDFTKSEIEYIQDNANFTEQQTTLFVLRNMDYTYEQCADMMNVSLSTVKRIGKKMKAKILKII